MQKLILILVLLSAVLSYSEENSDFSHDRDSAFVEVSPLWQKVIAFPFTYVIQPVFNLALFPISAPLNYAIKNGVIGKGVDLFSFGEKKNIFIYPTMNLKPGSQTSLGLSYRHRNMLWTPDYFSWGANQFANGDWNTTVSYNKHQLLESKISSGFRFRYDANRDAGFALPGSSESFPYTDSSFSTEVRISRQIPFFSDFNFSAKADFRFNRADIPETQADSILPTSYFGFNRYDRGFYQDFFYVPMTLSLTFDNVDAPYMPTQGSRLIFSWTYGKVGDYKGKNTDSIISNRLSHDYQVFELVAQHYIFLGTSGTKYNFTVEESRRSRRYYTDFSWDETIRMWKPENIRNTLFQRRVLAFQFRLRQLWEMEPGGAPYPAFSSISGRYPLRGYGYNFTDYAAMGISMEYRWPIDRLVDGVFFNEYAVYQRSWNRFEREHLKNSWGFGVRVRRPEMYFFRIQMGFHGLNGISFVMTVAPEFQ